MPNVLINKASELKPETRAAVEAELGRHLEDDEEVSIMAFRPHEAPAREARTGARHDLEQHLQKIDQKTSAVPEAEKESAINEASRSVRPGYRERK